MRCVQKNVTDYVLGVVLNAEMKNRIHCMFVNAQWILKNVSVVSSYNTGNDHPMFWTRSVWLLLMRKYPACRVSCRRYDYLVPTKKNVYLLDLQGSCARTWKRRLVLTSNKRTGKHRKAGLGGRLHLGNFKRLLRKPERLQWPWWRLLLADP